MLLTSMTLNAHAQIIHGTVKAVDTTATTLTVVAQDKEKCEPVWEPHYLAYPNGLWLPLIVADVSALVASGYRRIFSK
jgi:hypothetical protein